MGSEWKDPTVRMGQLPSGIEHKGTQGKEIHTCME